MPTTNAVWIIDVKGDAVRRRVTIDRAKSNIPTGVTVTKAWLTVRQEPTSPDPPLLEKVVTTTDVPGTGHIEDDGTGDVNIVLRFDLTADDTKAIGTLKDDATPKVFDVQVVANGDPYTPERGVVYCEAAEVTTATS